MGAFSNWLGLWPRRPSHSKPKPWESYPRPQWHIERPHGQHGPQTGQRFLPDEKSAAQFPGKPLWDD
eukprot:1121258-Pyramimonas_sp.AAC.1